MPIQVTEEHADYLFNLLKKLDQEVLEKPATIVVGDLPEEKLVLLGFESDWNKGAIYVDGPIQLIIEEESYSLEEIYFVSSMAIQNFFDCFAEFGNQYPKNILAYVAVHEVRHRVQAKRGLCENQLLNVEKINTLDIPGQCKEFVLANAQNLLHTDEFYKHYDKQDYSRERDAYLIALLAVWFMESGDISSIIEYLSCGYT